MMRCDNSNRHLSRSIVESALAIYIDNGLSVKYPVQCLDLSVKGEEGLKWIKDHSTSIYVIPQGIGSNQNDPTTNKTTKENDESKYVLIEKNDFNFIYVECTTEGSSYFDCVFRKIARNGLFALSTSDDPALYGRPPDPALRCYAGHIVRTFYAPELAVRLILAAMARSAARFSKSIEVLLTVVMKSSITILVKVKKGAESAVKCVSSVKTLAHCSICEERIFLSNNDGYVFDNVKRYLSCSCAETSEGRTVQALGPLWAAALGSPSFLTLLLPRLNHSLQLTSLLHDLITELRCDSQPSSKNVSRFEKEKYGTTNINVKEISEVKPGSTLKRKAEFDKYETKKKCTQWEFDDPEPAPAFYYNLHKHKPKGIQKLLKVDKVIDLLIRKGFRASRTHFDRAAVKTNCTLSELQSILMQVT